MTKEGKARHACDRGVQFFQIPMVSASLTRIGGADPHAKLW